MRGGTFIILATFITGVFLLLSAVENLSISATLQKWLTG